MPGQDFEMLESSSSTNAPLLCGDAGGNPASQHIMQHTMQRISLLDTKSWANSRVVTMQTLAIHCSNAYARGGLGSAQTRKVVEKNPSLCHVLPRIPGPLCGAGMQLTNQTLCALQLRRIAAMPGRQNVEQGWPNV
jgi:hypothetical protein